MIDTNDKEYEAEHLRHIAAREREIRRQYENAIHEISVAFGNVNYNGLTFHIKDYPALYSRITAQVSKLHASVYTTVVNAIEASWGLANEKNDVFVDKRLAGATPTKRASQILYDPNKSALDAYLARKEKGLNLSDRVWNSLDNYKTEMETALGVGVSEGRGAAEMAGDLKKYLREPDKLFRRVRQDDGTLKLSKAAREYHPGQGVYRSSYQNALRLTASETNISYRTSDHERWQQLPFVKAIEIKLSKNHPEFDICDALVGIYPKDYKHVGFHPRCLCYSVAVQISDAEYDKYEDSILSGGTAPEIEYVKEIPAKAKQYIEKNAERINGWSNKPYFIKDNPQYTKELLK